MKDHSDVIELLERLWDHFDKSADIHSDGSPNEALRFCADINDAVGLMAALRREHRILMEVGG